MSKWEDIVNVIIFISKDFIGEFCDKLNVLYNINFLEIIYLDDNIVLII